jgi:LmbE family N-acetylglucosaminyl deacetylase
MEWVYLSPHFDDVVYSCGGMIWEQVRAGQMVEVWTICAGMPGSNEDFSSDKPGDLSYDLSAFALQLHARWKTGPEAVATRRAEDEAAVRRLGAGIRYWDLPDCIYRRLPGNGWLVNGEEDLWQPVHPGEQGVVDRLADWLVGGFAQGRVSKAARLVSPLTLGNHVDHFLVRAAAEQAAQSVGAPLWYYPDYPYAAKADAYQADKLAADWQQVCQPVSREALSAWQEAVACYESQISTFWAGRAELDAALDAYWHAGGGACLWAS